MSKVTATWRSGERAGLITRRSLDRYQALLFFFHCIVDFDNYFFCSRFPDTISLQAKKNKQKRLGKRRGAGGNTDSARYILRTTRMKATCKTNNLHGFSLSCRKYGFEFAKDAFYSLVVYNFHFESLLPLCQVYRIMLLLLLASGNNCSDLVRISRAESKPAISLSYDNLCPILSMFDP